MSDVAIAFVSSPVVSGEQTAFVQASLGSTETTIELDLGGRVRLAAIAFGAGFEGETVSIKAVVPWAAADADAAISNLADVTIVAGGVVPLPFVDMFYLGKILLTVNVAQTSAHDIGFFGWRGRVE